ncbi:MAG: RNA polymerase sigma factor [Phycisphaerae bacterium]
MAAQPATGPTPPDEELIRRTRTGEPEAFDRLVERYQRRAVSVSYRLVGNLHDALEISQDAFVRAYRGLATLEDAQRFGAWFLRIVTNLSLNFRRSRATRGRTRSFEDCILDDQGGADELVADSPASEERPGARLAARELSEIVQRALADLPEPQRVALVLFSIEQMPQKDVAEILGCSVEAVKWHVFAARKKLKERLADYV